MSSAKPNSRSAQDVEQLPADLRRSRRRRCEPCGCVAHSTTRPRSAIEFVDRILACDRRTHRAIALIVTLLLGSLLLVATTAFTVLVVSPGWASSVVVGSAATLAATGTISRRRRRR